ncbi:MAG: sialate O-acetylesterase [Saprospiraceae bacterium]|nr:sialate O-acetylesterase [Saprospiraceae bacterium]
MRKKEMLKIWILAMLTFCSDLVRAEVRLPHLFGDHMVLQRNEPLHFWGWAAPGEKVNVTLGSQSESMLTREDGSWSIYLSEMTAGGPFIATIEGSNRIEIADVLIGDVWVASGQSNMQWQIKQTPYEEVDTSWMKSASLRLYTVQIGSDYLPCDDVRGGKWQSLSRDAVADFSAVAYHFGKYISEHKGVPIGIINSSLGATAIETWMSNEALAKFDQFKPEIEPIIRQGKSFEELERDFDAKKSDWEKIAYLSGPGIEQKWYLSGTDLSLWADIQVPGFWEDQGLTKYDGSVWYRKEFDRPEGSAGSDSLLLQLSQIDDYDLTWVNGVQVGETYGRHNHRNYWLQDSLLRDKGNVLVVRVFDIGDKGGFSTNPFWMTELVRGAWKMRPGFQIDAKTFVTLPTVNVTPFSSPGILFNANIAPLTKMSIKGIIWYRGESNASRAEEYQSLFRTMIEDWRTHWKMPNLPFFFVQLANYQAEANEPGQSDWAELREAQSLALEMPFTGMAVTIDIGEANDIHPANKLDVGKRLGLAARKVAYLDPVIGHGPKLVDIKFGQKSAMVSYDASGGRLITKDKFGYIRGFQIAGSDQKFYWARAEIVGDQVRVYASEVANPVAVRYGWSNNPGPLDLVNEEGLPALPFRSDQWPGVTAGVKFDYQAARF